MAVELTPKEVADRSNGAITENDDRLEERIEEAVALLQEISPCLFRDGIAARKVTVAKGILKDALVRLLKREDSGDTGSYQSESAGPFSYSIDTRTRDGLPLLTRAEESRLKKLCGTRHAGSFHLRAGSQC